MRRILRALLRGLALLGMALAAFLVGGTFCAGCVIFGPPEAPPARDDR